MIPEQRRRFWNVDRLRFLQHFAQPRNRRLTLATAIQVLPAIWRERSLQRIDEFFVTQMLSHEVPNIRRRLPRA